jgi:hypothetical protein
MKKTLLLIFTLAVFASAHAQDRKLQIRGYSEVRSTLAWGDPAVQDDADNYAASVKDIQLIETGNTFLIPGFNLNLLSELSPKLFFQGEVFFKVEENHLNTELLRAYVDYRLSEKFNIQAGKFLTPFGYLSRNQYIYGYLNYSVKPREMVDPTFNYIPNFMTGIQVYGTLPIGETKTMTYRVAYGGLRDNVATGRQNAISFINQFDSQPGAAGSVEFFNPIGNSELIAGVSGYYNPKILTWNVADGKSVDESDPFDLELSEAGFSPYLRWDNPKYQFFGEFHATNFHDNLGVSFLSDYKYSAFSLEFLLKTQLGGKSIYPYVRYDQRVINDHKDFHPFYGLKDNNGIIEKSFVFGYSEIMFGAAFDVISNNRIKLEYGRYLDGPYPANRLSISTSFVF